MNMKDVNSGIVFGSSKTPFTFTYRSLGIMLFVFLLSSFFFQESSFVSAATNNTKYQHVSNSELEKIQNYLKKINKPAVLSIQSPDGDIIDCIDINSQPALDHPLLKNHKIQMIPPEMPKMRNAQENNADTDPIDTNLTSVWQTWHLNGTECPISTIPVRRTTIDDVLRTKSLSTFIKKYPINIGSRISNSSNGDALHEYAIAGIHQQVYGAKAGINVWAPVVERDDEFSLSQIWIVSGSGPSLNSAEAGWQVCKLLYGDNRPRFFVYWTRDGYQLTGCYNLKCPGFVQTTRGTALGGAISNISIYNGKQYEIIVTIYQDPSTKNWWLSVGNTQIGYWPSAIFTSMANYADRIDWGGEVVNRKINGRHTSTQMGSGHFASQSFRKASYFRNLEIVNSDKSRSPVKSIQLHADNSKCYSAVQFFGKSYGTHFYYGGPGRGGICP